MYFHITDEILAGHVTWDKLSLRASSVSSLVNWGHPAQGPYRTCLLSLPRWISFMVGSSDATLRRGHSEQRTTFSESLWTREKMPWWYQWHIQALLETQGQVCLAWPVACQLAYWAAVGFIFVSWAENMWDNQLKTSFIQSASCIPCLFTVREYLMHQLSHI